MIYMLDSNICIYIIKKRPIEVFRKLRDYEPADMAISAITVAELQFGVSKSSRPEHNREILGSFLAPFEVVPFGEKACFHYGEIRSTLERQGRSIGAMDLLIAAHALSLSLTLVTNNTAEFGRVPGLHLENWVS
jgi:tRNA(fMet)-specific endonuclease VapC